MQKLLIKQILAWLEEDYMGPVTLAQPAAVFGICVRECQQTFSSALHHAGAVSEPDAHAVYFSRQFRREVRITPREYRESQKCQKNL